MLLKYNLTKRKLRYIRLQQNVENLIITNHKIQSIGQYLFAIEKYLKNTIKLFSM